MLTIFVSVLAAAFIIAYGYYPGENLYHMGVSLAIAAFLTTITEFIVWRHNIRVKRDEQELQERINSVVIKDVRYESKGTAFPIRGR